MQLFNLTKKREPLIYIVAAKTYQDIYQSQLSIFEYLCKNNPVIIDEDLPEFIYYDPENGCVICLHNNDEVSSLDALAHLALFHYLIAKPSLKIREILRGEAELFIKHFNELAKYPIGKVVNGN